VAEFTIKHLEQFTGIKAHTIRTWEQRYDLFSPERQGNNIRIYTDQDLVKILNISLLYNAGLKISKIAALSEKQLQEKVKELVFAQPDGQTPGILEQLAIAMINLDEPEFERLVNSQTNKLGFEKMVTEILFPFLHKTGLMWQIGMISPTQEHFATNIIRQKLIVAVNQLASISNPEKKTFLFFLPENDLHELSLLFYNYVARSSGNRTYYFGQSLPLSGLQEIIVKIKPDYLVSVITQPLDIDLKEYLEKIYSFSPIPTLLISGYQPIQQKLSSSKRIIIFKSYTEFSDLIS
jgi:MerR family transcriptional regulator, light-induced transcriptional regulator